MQQTAYIYTLSDPLTKMIRYVGKTNNLKIRFKDHCACKSKTWCRNWILGLREIGLKPIMEVIEEYPQDEPQQWEFAERFWISYFRFLGFELTNLESGGGSGKTFSQATLMKMSRSQTGRKHSPESVAKRSDWHRGRTRSKETCERISLSKRGKKLTAEHIEKVASKNRGKKRSAEVVMKIRNALKGQRRTEEQNRANSSAQKEAWRKRKLNGNIKPRIFSPQARARMSASAKQRWARSVSMRSEGTLSLFP